MWLYRSLFAFDALVALVLAYFFLDGLQYGASPDYLTIWVPLLGIPIGLLVGGWVLKAKGKRGLASLVLGLLAVPPVLFIAFYGLLLATTPNWH
jgi:uncharacterized paraquat-inducible protein A